MFDLENQGQTPCYVTFLISVFKQDTNSILVSILTFSRSTISKMLIKSRDLNSWPRNSRSHTFIVWPFQLRLYTCCKFDLGVDSNIHNVKDLRKPKISHLTLTLGRQREGVDSTLLAFSPVTFSMIPIAKIASSYLIGDTFDLCDIILTLSRDICHDVICTWRWSKYTVITSVC